MATITRIATIQRSLRELGRIRLGDQVEIGGGRSGKRPRKLSTFRLTSASRSYIAAAAEAYGGTVGEWESPRGREYEVTIESPTLDVLVPPGDAVSQAYEMWTAAGCIRRCDGVAQETGEPCACPSDPNVRLELAARNTPEACKPTTRLWVILPRLPDLGRWRLESHGYYAAVELAGMAEIASMATSRGIMLPARLRIEQRRRKIPGKPTREYVVPVLELPETNFGQLVAGGYIPTTAGAFPPGELSALPENTPAPQLAAGRPTRTPRPVLGTAPALPTEAAFERPTPEVGTAPTGGGWPVENLAGEATPATTIQRSPRQDAAPAPRDTFAGGIRAAALDEGAPQGPLTGPQRQTLARVLDGLGPELVGGGLAALWGPEAAYAPPTAAQARAIELAADSDPEFKRHWRELVDHGGVVEQIA